VRFSMTRLIRPTALLVMGLSLVAVVLSHVVPSSTKVRTRKAPRYYGVNATIFNPPLPRNLLLDTLTGELKEAQFGTGGTLEYVSCSPWTDEHGEFELVGRLTTRIGRDQDALCDRTGLIRFRPSDKAPREWAELAPLISGHPCWVPFRPARLIIPAGDGLLYTQDFVAGRDPAAGADDPKGPQPIGWSCTAPGSWQPILSDPYWPDAPTLGGRMIVSLVERRETGVKPTFATAKLWWLQLDQSGTSIIDAGRLTVPPPDSKDAADSGDEERQPNLAVAPDGRLVLAYLSSPRGKSTWRINVAPVRTEPGTGRPFVLLSESRETEGDVAMTRPAFSPDGQWVYGVTRSQTPKPGLMRFPVLESLKLDKPGTDTLTLTESTKRVP
jgi:hypothetical protein